MAIRVVTTAQKPFFISSVPSTNAFVCVRDLWMSASAQLTQLLRDHRAELSCVDEQRLALLLFVLGEKPERHRNLCCVKELGRHCDNAVHKVSVDDVLADLTLPPD